MKKWKMVSFMLVIALLSIYLYKSDIYYRIPFNPIEEHAAASGTKVYLTKNLPDGNETSVKCEDASTCDRVMEYISGLNLVPVKEKKAHNLLTYKGKTYYTGMLKVNKSDNIFLSDISEDTPNILHIASSIPGFKSGYYQVKDSTFDYDYLFDLMSTGE